MNKRPIDRTKKSNIKCEHCRYFCRDFAYESKTMIKSNVSDRCEITGEVKFYYNRCKEFEWK